MIFSDNYEIQTKLFLVTIIFVIMLTACYFGNIFGTIILIFRRITKLYMTTL